MCVCERVRECGCECVRLCVCACKCMCKCVYVCVGMGAPVYVFMCVYTYERTFVSHRAVTPYHNYNYGIYLISFLSALSCFCACAFISVFLGAAFLGDDISFHGANDRKNWIGTFISCTCTVLTHTCMHVEHVKASLNSSCSYLTDRC